MGKKCLKIINLLILIKISLFIRNWIISEQIYMCLVTEYRDMIFFPRNSFCCKIDLIGHVMMKTKGYASKYENLNPDKNISD